MRWRKGENRKTMLAWGKPIFEQTRQNPGLNHRGCRALTLITRYRRSEVFWRVWTGGINGVLWVVC